MIISFVPTGDRVNTTIHLPQSGFDADASALDSQGKHTLLWVSQQEGVPNHVWSFTSAAFRNTALTNILDAIAGAVVLASCASTGVVTEQTSS